MAAGKKKEVKIQFLCSFFLDFYIDSFAAFIYGQPNSFSYAFFLCLFYDDITLYGFLWYCRNGTLYKKEAIENKLWGC